MDKIPASHKIGVILAWIVVVATGGCSRLYEVTSDPGGIPFLAVVPVARTTAIYEQRYFELKLEMEWVSTNSAGAEQVVVNILTDDPSIEKLKHKTVNIRFTSSDSCARDIFAKFGRANNAKTAYDSMREYMIDMSKRCACLEMTALPWHKRKQLSENTKELHLAGVIKERLTRPGTTVMYINVKKASSGSTQGNITLNKNGTLASAEADVTDTTLQTVLGALPVSKFASSVLGLAPAAAPGVKTENYVEDRKAIAKSAILTLTPIVRRYAVSIECELASASGLSIKPGKTVVSRKSGNSDETDSAAKTDESKCDPNIIPVGSMEGASIRVVVVRGDPMEPKSGKAEKKKSGIEFRGWLDFPIGD